MKRTDGNHKEIVKTLRELGASVQSLAELGSGCPDILENDALYKPKGIKSQFSQIKCPWVEEMRSVRQKGFSSVADHAGCTFVNAGRLRRDRGVNPI